MAPLAQDIRVTKYVRLAYILARVAEGTMQSRTKKYKKRSHWRPALMKKYYTITQKNAPWVAGDNL